MRLVGAFVLASSLGALVALTTIRMRELSARHSEGNQRQETVAATAIDGDSAPVDVVTTQTNEESSTASTVDTTVETPAVVTNRPARVSPRKHQTINADLDDQRSEDEPPEVPVDSKPEPRLVDQWQEGRPRRVRESRPSNDGGAHHPRDLRDLYEIFEGPAKRP